MPARPLDASDFSALAARLLAPPRPRLVVVLAALAEATPPRVQARLAEPGGESRLLTELDARLSGEAAWNRLADLGLIDPAWPGDPGRRFLGPAGYAAAPWRARDAATLAAVGGPTVASAEELARASAERAAAAGLRGPAGSAVAWRAADAIAPLLDAERRGGWRRPGARDEADARAIAAALAGRLRALGRGAPDPEALAAAVAADLAGTRGWDRVGGAPETDPYAPLVMVWALGLAVEEPPAEGPAGAPVGLVLVAPALGRPGGAA